MTEYTGYDWSQSPDGIVTITMDDPNSGANIMNQHFLTSLEGTVERLEAEVDSITGVIIKSAKKKIWFAGADLTGFLNMPQEALEAEFEKLEYTKSLMRRLEQLGKPVVAAINGAALGGGFELALACHHRIAASDNGRIQLGLPEVSLGLLPGGGGVTRVTRMLGLQKALQNVILPAKPFDQEKALAIGLIDDVVPLDQMDEAARAWIKENPAPVKPWDERGFKIPGGAPKDNQGLVAALPAQLRKQLKGAPMPAPLAAMSAAVEGARVDFDTASTIESRYLISLLGHPTSTNMITAFFFNMQAIKAGKSRPEGFEKFQATKVGVLGAGMMGAAIAYVSAKAGIDVVLKDVSKEAAEKGKDYARKLEAKALERGRTTEDKSQALLDRITTTGDAADFKGVDFVIEAVFENVDVKQQVFQEIQDVVEPDAVLGSNTSTLPITTLAEGVERKEDFIGIHFFSPVDKMPLVEIIRGEKTSDAVLAKTFDFVQQIRKTPIVVTDSRGFFTSRVIGTFLLEAIGMVGEGVEPQMIEQAALQAGYPAGPLQLMDELTLTLNKKIADETRAANQAEGKRFEEFGLDVVEWMIDEGRTGRKDGAGFYEYEDGQRARLWPGLREKYNSKHEGVDIHELGERMLFAEAIDSVNCLEEGVLTTVADGNIGSILGIGFPAWTGGVLQYINGYPGGMKAFVARAEEFAQKYGERFAPSDYLKKRAEAGEAFL